MWTCEMEEKREAHASDTASVCDACCEQTREEESEPERPPHELRSLRTCAQKHND